MAIAAETVKYGPWTQGVRYDLPPEDITPNGLRKMTNTRLNAAAAVERRLALLCAEALRTGPGGDGVCVLPAPLLTAASGKKTRVDRGWFYRGESEHEVGAPKAQNHVIWTLDKF